MTELLTRKFCNENYMNVYHLQVLLCDIILGSDPSFVNAYFSRNDKDVILFLKKMLENQNTLNFEDIANMSKEVIFDHSLVYKYLKGFIEYSLNTTPIETYDFQVERIKQIVSELDNDIDYELDNDSYVSIVDQIINELRDNKVR